MSTRRFLDTKRLVLGAAVLLLVVSGVLPLVTMVLRSLWPGGQFSLAAYAGLLNSGRQWILIGHSLSLAGLTTLLTVVLGVPLGVLLGRTDLPWRRFLTSLFTVPLLVPPYVTAISWFDLLGRQGVVSQYMGPTAAQASSDWLFGLPGCVLVLTATFLPVVLLLTMTYLRTIDPELEAAGRLATGWPGVMGRIVLPLALPGIGLAALLVFLLTLGEFGVPNLLGYNVFAVESFTQFSAFYDFGAATAAAMPLLVITFLVLLVERKFIRTGTWQLQPAIGERLPIELGPTRKRWLTAVLALALGLVVLPLLVLVVKSLTAGAYQAAWAQAAPSLGRSVGLAFTGATLLTVVGFLLGYLIQDRVLPLWRAIDSVTIFLFVLSGTVIGIGLISLWNHPATNFIYGTPVIILLGYLARYTALTSRITVSSLAQIPPAMEESAQMLGAGWLRRLILVVVPLIRRGLVAGWLASYIFCLRDMGVTMLVYPPGLDTFPVRIFTLMANGADEMIAALCVILLVVTLLPVGVASLILGSGPASD